MRLTQLLPAKLGFGTAPLGNMFRAIPEEEAQPRWTPPGTGDPVLRHRALLRCGPLRDPPRRALSSSRATTFVLSTKVGRVILDEVEDTAARDLGEKGGVFEHGRPNKMSTTTRLMPPCARSRTA